MIEMRVSGLTIDQQTKTPIVLLRQVDGDQVLSIWVGALEAMAVSLMLNNEQLPRPLTHDLLLLCLQGVQATLTHVEITHLRDGVYYAILSVRHHRRLIRVDCRPSDAIALAIKANIPIQVRKEVFRNSAGTQTSPQNASPQMLQEKHPIDAATEMLRKVNAKHEVEIMNDMLRRTGELPDADDPATQQRLLDLLRNIEPFSCEKM